MSIEYIYIDRIAIQLITIIANYIMKEKYFINDLDNDIVLIVSKSRYINNLLSY